MDAKYRHALRAGTERLFAGILGVVLGPVTVSGLGTPDAFVQVSVTGWGPSLHVRERPYRVSLAQALLRSQRIALGEPRQVVEAEVAAMHPFEFPLEIQEGVASGTPELFGEIVAGHLAGAAEVQRGLAQAGALLGLVQPLLIPHDKAALAVDHLLISRPIADMMARDLGDLAAWTLLRDLVWKALREDGGSSDRGIGIPAVPGEGRAFGVTCEDGPPTVWIERLVIPSTRPCSGHGGALATDVASFDGRDLLLPHGLPAGVGVAAAGRRLGELVETGIPSLDESTITEVETDCDGRTWITLESKMARLGRLRAQATRPARCLDCAPLDDRPTWI